MRFLLTLCSVSCVLCTPATGQWLETTIALPDSLGGITYPERLAYDTRDDVMYVSGEGRSILALECATGRKLARIPLHANASALCYDSVHNEIYAAENNGYVSVIDCSTNTVAAIIPLGAEPYRLCYNRACEKLYCATDSRLLVIDCRTRRITASLAISEPWALCADARYNRVYCWSEEVEGILVIDCTVDTVVATLPNIYYVSAMVCNEAAGKTYALDMDAGVLYAIDGATSQVVAAIPDVGYSEDELNPFCIDHTRNKLYCGDEESNGMIVIDCGADTVVARVDVGNGAYSPCWNPAEGRVYCATYDDELVVVDCSADTLAGRITVGLQLSGMACSPVSDRVLVTCPRSNEVLMLDCGPDTLAGSVRTGMKPYLLSYNSQRDKVYCGQSDYYSGQRTSMLAVIDAAANRSAATLPCSGEPWDLCYNPATDKLYCAGRDDTLTVIDCSADTVRSMLGMNVDTDTRVCANTVNGKVYCTVGNHTDTLVIVDGQGDTIRRRLPVTRASGAMCFNPTANKVYVASSTSTGSLTIVDGERDTTIRVLPTGFGYDQALCYCPRRNVVYCADRTDLLVIDGATDSVLVRIAVSFRVDSLCYDPAYDQLYCMGAGSNGCIVVVDCAVNQVSAVVPTYGQLTAMVCDTIAGKLYCADAEHQALLVIDCATNRVVQVIDAGAAPAGLAWSPAYRRVFVANEAGSSVSVIADTAVAGLEGSQPTAFAWQPSGTIIRGVLRLAQTSNRKPQAASLMDAGGRRVMDLKPGANDVRHLPAGVYFVRGEGWTRKEVIAR